MTIHGWIQFFVFIAVFVALVPLIGRYIAGIYYEERTFLDFLLGPLEKISYKLISINPFQEMNWIEYTKSLVYFNLVGFLFLFLLLMGQYELPLNPQNFSGVSWDLAYNIAMSFVTNTNWQSYAGETTLSYLTQMLGLTVQNFLSAATGMAVLFALMRGITRRTTDHIGNFWIDLVRTTLYLLMPLSFIFALVLVANGVIQNFSPYLDVTTLEGAKQIIPMGPAASQIAIKQLGTNGGGFFNANSAHPFENPTLVSNFLQTLALLLIPASLTYTFGLIVNSKKQGWLIFGVMLILWITGCAISYYGQHVYNPLLETSQNLEGIETRFGTGYSLLWSTTTTATANGSVNVMISSLSPLAGGIALFNIMLGEMIFGGVGVGLCSMIMFLLLTVFLSGLMVGRTPEYLGKKIEKKEIQWISVAVLLPGCLVLLGSAIASALPYALSSLSNQGPHGLTEILYAFASSAGNNGSAFAGLNANTPFYNLALGTIMLLGRLAIVLPSMAVAGLLAQKRIAPPSIGSFSTETPLFFILLIFVILIVGALTFFPALSLGPIVEHLLMLRGRSF